MPSKKNNPPNTSDPLLPVDSQPEKYLLRLYVAGTTPASTRAISDARKFCEEQLGGRYKLEVIDIYQRPALARDEQIIAVPTLVRHLPPPLRKLVGDLSNTERVLIGLDLLREDGSKPS
jgi:circadian clock protein KaiB